MKLFGKLAELNAVELRKNTRTILISANSGTYSGNVTLYLPPLLTGSDTLVDTSSAQTLSNKTADNSTVATLRDDRFTLQEASVTSKQAVFKIPTGQTSSTTRTHTLPATDSVLVGEAQTQTLQNKTLDNTTTASIKDTSLSIEDAADSSKKAQFNVPSGQTGSTTRTHALPATDSTLVGETQTQTLSNKTLDNSTTAAIKDTSFTLEDASDSTKKAVLDVPSAQTGSTTRTHTLPATDSTLVGETQTQTLTNKTLGNSNTISARDDRFTLEEVADTSKKAYFKVPTSQTGSTTREHTLPATSSNLVGESQTQTLTNKTLTTPVIDDYLAVNEESAPATPSAGTVRVYAKSDHKIYKKGSDGVEQELGPGESLSGTLTTLGDIVYENATPTPTRLAGNTTTTKKFLRQVGNGTISAAPSWEEVTGDEIKGTTTGSAAATGYLGETLTQSSGTSSTSSHNTFIDFIANKSIPAGRWLVVADGSCYLQTPDTGLIGAQIEIYNDTDGTTLRTQSFIGYLGTSAIKGDNGEFGYCMVTVLNLIGSKNIKVRAKAITESGSPTSGGIASRSNGQLLAVRIG